MAVRAKFYVQKITLYAHGGGQTEVTLSPVTRGKDNKEWAAATPCGAITMTIQNPDAAAQFTIGDEFYIDFTSAPKGQEG